MAYLVEFNLGSLSKKKSPIGNPETHLVKATFASEGRGEIVKLLLERNADPDLKNIHGISPKDLANTIANYDLKRFFE